MRRGDYERWLAEPGSFALVAEEGRRGRGLRGGARPGPGRDMGHGRAHGGARDPRRAARPPRRRHRRGADGRGGRGARPARHRRRVGGAWWRATPTPCASTSAGACGPTCTGCTGVGFPAMGEIGLHHRRAGEGEPLVAIHGIGSSWQVWNPVLPALEERHDVLALSLPGYGESAPRGRRADGARAGGRRRGGDGRGRARHRAHRRELAGRLDRRRARRPRPGANGGGHLPRRDVDRQGAEVLARRCCASPTPRPSGWRPTPSASPRRPRGGGSCSG